MCLTWAMISLPGFSYASNTLGIPTDLRVTSVHDLTIMLTWKRPLTTAGTPDNSSLSYIVTFSSGGINIERQIVTTESAQLDLVVNKQYNIFVKAIQRANHQIQGVWSGALRVDTKDLAPAKPANLQMTNRRNGLTSTITVRWDKPRTTVQGITDTSILKYYVAYTNLESKREGKYQLPSKSPTSVKVVSSTPSSINVSWGPIPKEGRNGIILGFVVFYREDGSSKWSERDVTLVYSLELTGLTAGKLYYVTVAGYTKIGRGTKSTRKSIIVGGIHFNDIHNLNKQTFLFARSILFPLETCFRFDPKIPY
ncbi:hypothetical protein OS493_029591 [Desmophyllum pertusum]|uniref:Fibronectin type-III domain-containing protein n=1 Tax=Desmophyllum pertusum TaxID=174260 RepID=A0A9W9ZZ12_9CNID|nr:hypothetical protein OS493_029591 [Desmophyllum pertusum]